MTLGRTLFIVNPAARHGETRKLIPLLEAAFGGAVDREIRLSGGPRHASDLARTAEGFDTIVAVGGDGTAHEVLNGIMAHDEATRPALAIIPTGSGNDYAHTLGMSDDPSTALSQLATGKPVSVDLGLCNATWFGESFSAGLDARVTIKAAELKVTTGLSGLALYMRSLMHVLNHEYYAHHVVVQYDDDAPFETDLLICAITNGVTYGGGFRITPDSVPDDGLFDVCRIDWMPRSQAFVRLPFVVLGRHTKMKPVHMARVRRVTIVSETPLEGQIDGETVLESAYDVRIVPGAAAVIVPADWRGER